MAAANPAAAHASLLEPFAAGAEAIDRHRRVLAELGAALPGGSGKPSETMAIGMGAAVLWPVERCLLEGESDAIPALASDAVKFTIAARRRAEGAEWSQSRAAEDAGRSRARAGEPSNEPPAADARVLGPLPTGRHGMTRAAVRHSQRERLLASAVEAVVERGYAETRIGDVVARAAVSRRVFYENFESVEECFLCAAEIVARHFSEIAAQSGAAEKADPPGRQSRHYEPHSVSSRANQAWPGRAWWNHWRRERWDSAATAKRSTGSRWRSGRVSQGDKAAPLRRGACRWQSGRWPWSSACGSPRAASKTCRHSSRSWPSSCSAP